MEPTIVPASFRDPGGFVWKDGTAIFRHVGEEHRENYDLLLSSGLYEELVADSMLVPHEEMVDVTSPRPGAYKVLRPEVVEFISYPYEWCFGQLKDAALLTLEIQKRALDRGMSLRDASAYNVQFHRGRPVLIDTLSFEALRQGSPWIAYRQFCQHFLAPLALMSHCDVMFGQLSRLYVDGIPVDLAARLLPRRTRYSPGLLAHIHTQARVQARHEKTGRSAPSANRSLSLQSLRGIVWNLERVIRKLDSNIGKTAWGDYYEESSHYSHAALEHKHELVGSFLDEAGGATVWDFGANLGVFSRLAAARGSSVICFDLDHGCVEANYRRVVAESESNVLPLLSDLRNPSAGIGWANRERSSLFARGPADVLMALALVHHLAIGNNVPFEMIADFFSDLGRALIVEFVPKHDPMVQRLLETRDDIFPTYTQDSFERAFERRYTIDRREDVKETDRTLYLMRRR